MRQKPYVPTFGNFGDIGDFKDSFADTTNIVDGNFEVSSISSEPEKRIKPDTPFVPQLSWETAVDVFLWSRKAMGVSDRTVAWHKLSLKLFLQCHKELSLSCSPINCTPEHLRAFLIWLSKRNVKLVSQNTYYRSIRAFFRFLVHEGLRKDIPTNKVAAPKIEEPLPKTVTEKHFIQTIQAICPFILPKSLFKDTRWTNALKWHELRNLALFVMAFDTGARLGELLSLKVGDVDLQKRMALVKGKGRKERIIVFGTTTTKLLVKYLITRKLFCGDFSNDSYLFVFKNGSPLNRSYVGKEWRKAQRKAGLSPLPFHGLRHGFARIWLLRGGDVLSLQILLGHTSSEMTKRYVRLWGADLQKLHAQVSPVDKLSD